MPDIVLSFFFYAKIVIFRKNYKFRHSTFKSNAEVTAYRKLLIFKIKYVYYVTC